MSPSHRALPRRIGVLAVAAAILLACGLDVVGADAPSGTSGASPGGAFGDGGTSIPGPPDLCEKSPCVPPLPGGWSFASPVSASGPAAGVPVTDAVDPAVACPAGWTSVVRYFDDPKSASDVCTCSCGRENGPCKTTISHDAVASCVLDDERTADGNCHDIPPTNNAKRSAGSYVVTCTGGSALPGVTANGSSYVCVLAGSPTCTAAGCAVTAPTGTKHVCAIHDGEVTCPAGYPTRARVTTAAAITDQRSCGCSCLTPSGTPTATAACGTTLTFYALLGCNGSERPVTPVDSCTSINGSLSYRVSTSLTVPVECAGPATAPVVGAVTSTAWHTLCCSE
jgi:hypothetical protein